MAALVDGRELDLTLVSAENLPDVRIFGQMKVYAVVSLNGSTKITGVDMAGETNPTWNFVAGYTVEEAAVQQPEVSILVKLWCQRSLGDRLIGEVKIGVKDLFEYQGTILIYRVIGTPDGVLNISCSFGPKMVVSVPRPNAAVEHDDDHEFGVVFVENADQSELFNGDDHAFHVHDQNDHHGYYQEDGDEGDDDEDEDEDRPNAARSRRQSSSSGMKVLKMMMSLGLSLADELFNGDDDASHVHESSSSSGKKVLKTMMTLGLSLADELFNGDDHASHVHDQNDHHGYDQEDGDEGDDDDKDGGSCNDDEDDDDEDDYI